MLSFMASEEAQIENECKLKKNIVLPKEAHKTDQNLMCM